MAVRKLMFGNVEAERLAEEYGTPLYVYEEDVIRQRFREVKEAISYPKLRMYYACKANQNPAVMRILMEEGAGIDAVSLQEVMLALKVGFKAEDILFTGNNISKEEMEELIKLDIMINIDSLHQLESYGSLNPGSDISVRINPDVGLGHHNHVITGGPDSKFGIYFDKAEEIKKIAAKHNLMIKGIHMHVGSRFLDQEPFIKAMGVLLDIAKDFNDLEFIDFGGGLGVPYSPDEGPIDVKKFGRDVSEIFNRFCSEYGKQLVMCFENGRYYVAEAGHLLARVTSVKETPKHRFVGVDSGFNHLIRPAMYGSYHEILNASDLDAEKEKVVVAGNLCESGDIFTIKDEQPLPREIARLEPGNIVSIEMAGAYGYCMSSNYNMRLRPAEVLEGKNVKLIRKRETFDDLLRGIPDA